MMLILIPGFLPEAVVRRSILPFLRTTISQIRAPFPQNPWSSSPDFPPKNLFIKTHSLWHSHTLCQREPDDRERDRTTRKNGESRRNLSGTFKQHRQTPPIQTNPPQRTPFPAQAGQ